MDPTTDCLGSTQLKMVATTIYIYIINQNGYTSVYFTNIEWKFSVVVTASISTYTQSSTLCTRFMVFMFTKYVITAQILSTFSKYNH